MKLSEPDWMPESLRLAACRGVNPDTRDVRFRLITFEAMRMFPVCPKCRGKIIRDCPGCDGHGHISRADAANDETPAEFANKKEFYALVGDAGAAKFLWYDAIVNGQMGMPCHDCDVTGPQKDCKYCHGRGYWDRKPKEMNSWCEGNGFEELLAKSSQNPKVKKAKKVKSV
jgi:DnaJ-class molecular chaperone